MNIRVLCAIVLKTFNNREERYFCTLKYIFVTNNALDWEIEELDGSKTVPIWKHTCLHDNDLTIK